MNSECLWSNKTCYKQKCKIYFVTSPPISWRFESCFWFVQKENKEAKANLLLKFWETLTAPLLHSVFFTDCLKYKTFKWTVKAPIVHCEIKTYWNCELDFCVEQEGSHASWEKIRISTSHSMNIYIKSEQTNTNNVLRITYYLLSSSP